MKTTIKLQSVKVITLSIFVMFNILSFSNATGSIVGKVFNNQNQPVENATATIISPESMTIVEGDMCDDEGNFVIENVEPGEYILSVRQVGYEKDETRKVRVDENNTFLNVNTVVLNETNILLKEIEVVTERKTKVGIKNS